MLKAICSVYIYMERKFPSAGLDFTKALVFRLWPISQSPGELAKTDCWHCLQKFRFHRSWVAPEILHYKFLGNSEAASPGNWGIPFWESLHLSKIQLPRAAGIVRILSNIENSRWGVAVRNASRLRTSGHFESESASPVADTGSSS